MSLSAFAWIAFGVAAVIIAKTFVVLLVGQIINLARVSLVYWRSIWRGESVEDRLRRLDAEVE